MTYRFISTPSHGYLTVPMEQIRGLQKNGIMFSNCSYQSGGFGWLEEDCDAPKFIEHCKLTRDDIEEVNVNEDFHGRYGLYD
jgi:hypothetical protein